MREKRCGKSSQAEIRDALSHPHGGPVGARAGRGRGRIVAFVALISVVALLSIPAATVGGADREGPHARIESPGTGSNGPGVPTAQAPLRVAVTIDDLPKVAGGRGIEDARRVTDAILEALNRYDAPAVGFVTSAHVLVRGQVDERLDLLRQWRDAGFELANHSYSHIDFQRVSLRKYQDDFIKGDLLPRLIMDEAGRPIRYFRHPFTHTGPDAGSKRAFEAFAAERGYIIAPFTIEHADYIYNLLHIEARKSADSARLARIEAAYLEQLDAAFDFAERLSRETFGREIPQVLLTHANDINADHLDLILERLAARGYEFVTVEEAMADPAYSTPDRYVGRFGPSWLHRWRLSLGLEDRLREEPDPPSWVLEAYRELQSRR